jgi:tetratricopeptide (TPR) repeat protein
VNNVQVGNGKGEVGDPIGSTLLQRYQILERLGQTGSTTTYLAIDLQIPGSIQLKCTIERYQLSDPDPEGIQLQQAVRSAQQLYELSRRIDRLPSVYSYFEQNGAFYVVREYIAGVPLAQELSGDRAWTPPQVMKLLADLLEVLHDIERCGANPAPISLSQIVRRHLDRKLTIVNLDLATDLTTQAAGANQPDLRQIGEIAIAAAMGISGAALPLTAIQKSRWQQQAARGERPELLTIIDRAIADAPADRYPSISAAWQAVASAIPKFLVHQQSRTETRTEIARHIQLSIERGTEFYELGNCQQAMAAYDRAIALDPQCVDAYCGRGNARRFLGDYLGSWEDFDRAIQLDADRGVAYIGRALAASFARKLGGDAIADFERGRNLLAHPTTAMEYVMRGTATAQLGDARAAIVDYTSAIALNPRLVVAYNNRGNLWQHLGNLQGGITDFSKVIEIDADSAIAYNNRAIIYTQIGQFPAAVADYTKAIELQPDFVSVYNNLGNAYCQMGENTLAIDRYTQALSIDPEFAVAYGNRANIYRLQGDLTAALVDYDRAIDLDPTLVIAYYNRGICHRQLGNHQMAIDNYTQTLALDRQYFYAYYHRANARQYLGDKHGAIADFTQTICLEPTHLHAYYNRAIVRSEIYDYNGAMDDLDRAIELHPQFTLAHLQRGRLFATNGEHHSAIANYHRAIGLQSDNLDAYYQRGCSYLSLGDLSAALSDFDRTISLDSNYAPAYYQRGKISAQLGDRAGAMTNYHRAANLYLDRGDSKTYQQILTILDRLTN